MYTALVALVCHSLDYLFTTRFCLLHACPSYYKKLSSTNMYMYLLNLLNNITVKFNVHHQLNCACMDVGHPY